MKFIVLKIGDIFNIIGNMKYTFIKKIHKNEKYIKCRINGSLMMLDLNDPGICKDLIINKIKEPFCTEKMKKIIGSDDIIIDIGANIGYYVLLEAKLAKSGKVYAIEPVPANLELLKRNVELNNYYNVEIFNYGIGDTNEEREMFVVEKSNLCSFIKDPYTDIKNKIKVPVIKLDDFVEKFVGEYPSLIRMDTEGFEYNIIKGADKILKNNKPLKLFIELHPCRISEEKINYVVNTLEKNSFRVEFIYYETQEKVVLYHLIKILSTHLNRKKVKIKYGYIGNSYDTLRNFLKIIGWINCFFIRE